MTVVEGSRFGSRGRAQIPSADDVLIAAIELVLTGAGLPKALEMRHRHEPETGFVIEPVAGAGHTRAVIAWREEGEPVAATAEPAGKLSDCEQALRRAGYHVEYTTEINGGCLLASRIRRYA